MSTTEKLCFVIEGGYLTDLTRSLWADEDEPQKAIRILTSAFPDMSRGQILSVLQGDKKLIGDSKRGIALVDDGEEASPHGNPLSADSVVGKLQKKLKRSVESGRDMAQMLVGDTIRTGSRKGLVEYPSWRRKAFQEGEIKLDDMLYREVDTGGFFNEGAMGQYREDEEDDKPAPPPKPERSISTDSGWLSPEGKFYRCGYMEHIGMARRLGFQESSLEKLGWVKLTTGHGFLAPDRDVTQSQIDMIWDYCQEHGEEMPWWTEKEED